MATCLEGSEAGQKTFWRPKELPEEIKQTGIIDLHGGRFFVERLNQEPELVICGGGHISLELAVLADFLEYPYVVLDDREEFCNKERFPHARACIAQPFAKSLSAARQALANTYYIIVTRGHQADLECLELILNRPYGYIGMIGSRAKVAKTMKTLLEKGYRQEQLDQVHAPIGLDIGGQTPKEIAVSIAAQLIQKKNQEHPSSYLENKMIRCLQEESHGIMVTVIDKQGSAPRGVGSRMLVGSDGIICGTIGGGMVEYEASQKAIKMAGQPNPGRYLETVVYQVNHQSAASLGMWCGGQVEVLFERL